MVTSLAQQLGRIAATTSNTLDLKLVRREHSKSLLFEPKIAVNQSYDQLYAICYEGFRELCQLDGHYKKFGSNIFGPQSKDTERSQLTEKENKDLDVVLEDFLQLVGSRLNLRAGQKAVEWLIRRFKVHESNVVHLVFAFIPYHTSPIFRVLLSLLPPSPPSILRFLEPYRKSTSPLVRQAIVSATTGTPVLFTRLAHFVLHVCEKGYEHQDLVSWWTGISAEALATQLEMAKSGRKSAEEQKQEDILIRMLPILNTGLPLSSAADLQVAIYILLCILASKTNLNDQVLLALTETVASTSAPKSVKAARECVQLLAGRLDDKNLLPGSKAQELLAGDRSEGHLVANKQTIGGTPGLSTSTPDFSAARVRASDTFDGQIKRLELLTPRYHDSFLADSTEVEHQQLKMILSSTTIDTERFKRIMELPVVRGSSDKSTTRLSFLCMIWCGGFPASLKTLALGQAEYMIRQTSADYQALYPYLIVALRDHDDAVRTSAAQFIRTLHSSKLGKEFWALEDLYGKSTATADTKWLTHKESKSILERMFLPSLEECVLDVRHIDRVIQKFLTTERKRKRGDDDPKLAQEGPLREAFRNFLSRHIVNTRFWTVKVALLETAASTDSARTILQPDLFTSIASEWIKLSPTEAMSAAMPTLQRHEQPDEIIINALNPPDLDLLKLALTSTDRPSLRSAVSRKLTEFVPRLSLDEATSFLRYLCAIVGDSSHALPSADARAVLGSVEWDPQAISDLGTQYLDALVGKVAPVGRKGAVPTDDPSRSSPQIDRKVVLRSLITLLEAVNDNCSEGRAELLRPAIQLLTRLPQSINQKDQTYAKGLALDLVQKSLAAYQPDGHDLGYVDPQVIVDFLQNAQDSQLQSTALLALSQLAQLMPAKVTRCIIPIFSTISSSVASRPDDFSNFVVDQILDRVIPHLVEDHSKTDDENRSSPQIVIETFAASFPQLPIHRRLPVFTKLTNALGALEYLSPVVLALGRQIGSVSCMNDLLLHYDVDVSLHAVLQCLSSAAEGTVDAQSVTQKVDHTMTSSEDATCAILTSANNVLQSKGFKARLRSARGDHDSQQSEQIKDLMSQSLAVILRAARSQDLSQSCYPLWQALFESILSLQTTADLILVARTFLQDETAPLLQAQVLEIVRLRILRAGHLDCKASAPCLRFLGDIATLLRVTNSAQIQQSCMQCAQAVTKQFGRGDPLAVIQLAEVICGPLGLESHSLAVQTSALEATASVVETSRLDFTPLLQKTLSTTVAVISKNIDTESQAEVDLVTAGVSVIISLVRYVPSMIVGDQLSDVLLVSCQIAAAPSAISTAPLREKLSTAIASNIDISLVAETIRSVTADACALGSAETSACELIRLFKLSIETHTKDEIVASVNALGSAFQTLLALRTASQSHRLDRSEQGENVVICGLEDQLFDAALTMIYKLDDRTFRPMFTALFDDIMAIEDPPRRKTTLISFYRFFAAFSERLKGLVTSYASIILDDTVSLLTSLGPSDKTAQRKSKEKSGKPQVADILPASEDPFISLELRASIFQALRSSFSHDSTSFWQSPTHFNPTYPALLGHLALPASPSQDPHHELSFITDEVVPTVLALATSLDSNENLKALNAALIKSMKSEDASTRIAGSICQRSLVEGLGHEWCELNLSELLPVLAEGMEDDDEQAEKQIRRLVMAIEEVMGESLSSMLT